MMMNFRGSKYPKRHIGLRPFCSLPNENDGTFRSRLDRIVYFEGGKNV